MKSMLVRYGTENTITQGDLFGSADDRAKNCRFLPVHKGHFFNHTQLSNVVEIVEQILFLKMGGLQIEL